MGYLYVALTIVFTVIGQIMIKWRLTQINVHFEGRLSEKLYRVISVVLDPVILVAFIMAFVASIFWILAMSKLDLTRAYPLMTLAPALVFLIGIPLLGEEFTWGKVCGLFFILLGAWCTVKV